MTAMIGTALATLGMAGFRAPASVASPPPIVVTPDDEDCLETEAALGPETVSDNDCPKPVFVAHTPAERAATYAGEMVKWCAGQELSWAEIRIDYRRFAKEQNWRMEIADRLLSKALKETGCTRRQEDRRKDNGGRPVLITIPWSDE